MNCSQKILHRLPGLSDAGAFADSLTDREATFVREAHAGTPERRYSQALLDVQDDATLPLTVWANDQEKAIIEGGSATEAEAAGGFEIPSLDVSAYQGLTIIMMIYNIANESREVRTTPPGIPDLTNVVKTLTNVVRSLRRRSVSLELLHVFGLPATGPPPTWPHEPRSPNLKLHSLVSGVTTMGT